MQTSDQPSSGHEPVVDARTYGFLGFMIVLNVLNILDRQMLPTFGNEIKAALHLSNGQYGLLTGLMFVLLYGLLSPFMGLIADAVHRPRFAAFGVGLWSMLTAASGLAHSFASLAIPRIFIGVGESTLTPTALSMLADRFPARRLGFASGAYYAGVPLGSGLAFFVAALFGPTIGWRNCFLIIGGVGVCLALVLSTLREPRGATASTGKKPLEAIKAMLALLPEMFGAMKRSPALLATMIGGIGVHIAVGAASFDTLWWKEDLHLNTGPLFLKIALMYATVGVAGNVLGGLMGDWWLKKTGQGRPMFIMLVLLVCAPINFLYRMTDHAGLMFWLGIGTGIFQLAAMYGGAYATVQELVPQRIRATAVAMFILGVNVVGIGTATTIGGFMVDAFAKAGHPRPISDMMLIMTGVSMLAIPAFFIAARRFGTDREALRIRENGGA